MIAERSLIISILKLTKDGAVLTRDVKADTRLPSDLLTKFLEKLENESLLKRKGTLVEIESESRLKLAAKAISLGADIEAVSSLLQWQEFESITAAALESCSYAVKQNLRFKHAGRKWEIDAIGCKKPLVVSVDCKSWHHSMSPSEMSRVVKLQVERTEALADFLPDLRKELKCGCWDRAKCVPVVLVLIPTRFKFSDGVPVVPVLQISDFLSKLPLEVEFLKYFTKEFPRLCHDS